MFIRIGIGQLIYNLYVAFDAILKHHIPFGQFIFKPDNRCKINFSNFIINIFKKHDIRAHGEKFQKMLTLKEKSILYTVAF